MHDNRLPWCHGCVFIIVLFLMSWWWRNARHYCWKRRGGSLASSKHSSKLSNRRSITKDVSCWWWVEAITSDVHRSPGTDEWWSVQRVFWINPMRTSWRDDREVFSNKFWFSIVASYSTATCTVEINNQCWCLQVVYWSLIWLETPSWGDSSPCCDYLLAISLLEKRNQFFSRRRAQEANVRRNGTHRRLVWEVDGEQIFVQHHRLVRTDSVLLRPNYHWRNTTLVFIKRLTSTEVSKQDGQSYDA